jgi:peptidoglycan/xylan/chitin deacetylase (PgdA/CDA1 family)
MLDSSGLTLTPMMQAAGLLMPDWMQARLSILIYHRIQLHPDPLLSTGPDADTFDWQMALINRYFNVLPLSQAIEALKKGALPPRAICVTFDDGYADNVHVVLPILQRYRISAAFFIATGYLDGGRMWNDSLIEAIRHLPGSWVDLSDYELGCHAIATLAEKRRSLRQLMYQLKRLDPLQREQMVREITAPVAGKIAPDVMLSSRQVVELHAAGMEIGSHTVTHPVLLKQSSETAWLELIDSRKTLETLISEPVRFFAYPHGKPGMDYGPDQVALVRKAGSVRLGE